MVFTSLMRRFTIRARMLGAIGVVLLMLTLVGSAGMAGMFRIQHEAAAFAAGPFADLSDLAALRQHMGDIRRFDSGGGRSGLGIIDLAAVTGHGFAVMPV